MDLRAELLASGLPVSVHSRLGYRMVTAEEAKKLLGFKLPGWVVPMNDPKGKPYTYGDGKPFYRLKPDPKSMEGENPPKYLSPVNPSGCRPYLSPLLAPGALNPGKEKDLTEGEKKADSATHNGFPTIGLSGVDGWRDRRKGQKETEESEPIPELEDLGLERSTVRIAFDSDIVQKPQVQAAMATLSVYLHEHRHAVPLVTFIPPELDGEKNGVDDFICRHGAEAYGVLRKLARPATKRDSEGDAVFCWQLEPKESHDKALLAWTVFKDNYAIRPKVGLHRWNGRHWERCPGKTDASALCRPLHLWMDHCGWIKRSTGLINSITSELLARLTAEDSWDREQLIGFANGTLNWQTGAFTPGHRREDFLTFCLPYDFNPKATCPHFHRFLNEACGGDAGLINLVRAGFRWTVAPKDTSKAFPLECAFDVTGRKGRGKGTLSEALQALVGGDHGRGLIRSSTFSNPNSLAGLIGKRLAMDPDADGRVSSAGTFNAVVSNEPVEVKLLYRDTHAARLGVVVWRFMNDSPGASGGGVEGMGRRIITIPFDVEPSNRDPLLKQKILSEAAGIFAWVWAMKREAMEAALEGSGDVAASAAASVEHALERDPVVRFLIETYPDGLALIPARDLFRDWCRWCDECRHKSGSMTFFGTNIKKVAIGEPDSKDFQGARFSRKSAGKVYSITPMRNFDLAAYFGVAQFNPASEPNPASDCSSSDPAPPQPSDDGVHSVHSSLFNLEDKKKDIDKGYKSVNRERFAQQLCTPAQAGTSNGHRADVLPSYLPGDDDPSWGKRPE